ncbi:hypothetical protein XENOCAPTIV_000244 [Xenoophorus captivus]|uniref:Secreted protein n=1 Tax=Xenoophorus captivus TaxID=1517983 RepID=A0ABV0Q451_9TELE
MECSHLILLLIDLLNVFELLLVVQKCIDLEDIFPYSVVATQISNLFSCTSEGKRQFKLEVPLKGFCCVGGLGCLHRVSCRMHNEAFEICLTGFSPFSLLSCFL